MSVSRSYACTTATPYIGHGWSHIGLSGGHLILVCSGIGLFSTVDVFLIGFNLFVYMMLTQFFFFMGLS